MNNYTLNNGWLVTREEQKTAILHVEPISNSIFSTSKKIRLPNVIFNAIANGERNVQELFRVYKMHDLIFQWDEKNTKAVQTSPKNTDTKFYGGGWFVQKYRDSYFLEFIKSSHGGGGRRIQINENIYNDIRDSGKDKSLSLLLDQYELRDQDITENDIG